MKSPSLFTGNYFILVFYCMVLNFIFTEKEMVELRTVSINSIDVARGPGGKLQLKMPESTTKL